MGDGFVNADLWVLEYLLEQDRVQDELIKQFCDGLGHSEGLPPIIQMRLMLRVLHGNVAVITRDTLHALDCLTTATHGDASLYPPYTHLRGATPTAELYLAVKTELVLRALRPGYVEEAPAQSLLDLYFGVVDDMDDADRTRRAELQEAIDDPGKVAMVQERYAIATVQAALAAYVVKARQELGPPVVKVVEQDALQKVYHPCNPAVHQAQLLNAAVQIANQLGMSGKKKTPKESGVKRKRKGKDSIDESEAGAVLADLQQQGKKLIGLGGVDPLPGVIAQALQAGQDPTTSFQQAVEEAAGDARLQRNVFWTSPEGILTASAEGISGGLTPQQVQLAVSAAMSPGGSADRKNNAMRRRNGRWNEKETQLLIALVRRLGKGKWKRILEEGASEFQNRSQVDLKDKWRNLERQNVVGPADIGPQDPPPLSHAEHDDMGMGMPHPDGQGLPPVAMDVGPEPDGHPGLPHMMTDDHTGGLGDEHLSVPDLGPPPDVPMHPHVDALASAGLPIDALHTQDPMHTPDPMHTSDPMHAPDSMHTPEPVGVQ